MFPFIYLGEGQQNTLKPDDAGGVTEIYPFKEFNDQVNGQLSGLVKLEGQPVFGVDVIAYSGDEPVVSAITREDGTYRIHGVPAGDYTLRAQLISPSNVNLAPSIATDFHSQYHVEVAKGVTPNPGLSTDAAVITVEAGKRRGNVNFDLVSATTPDFFEPNDSSGQATTLATDSTRMIHQFYTSGDSDWVRFTGAKGVNYQLVTDNLSFFADPVMQLYASDGVTLLNSNDDVNVSAGNYAARIGFTPAVDGTYFVRLTDSAGYFGGGTNFEFSILEAAKAGLDANYDGSVDVNDLLLLGTRWHADDEANPVKESDLLSVREKTLLELLDILTR